MTKPTNQSNPIACLLSICIYSVMTFQECNWVETKWENWNFWWQKRWHRVLTVSSQSEASKAITAVLLLSLPNIFILIAFSYYELLRSNTQHSTLNNHRFLFIIIIFIFLYHDKIAGPCGQRSWIDWQSPGWAFSRSSCWPYFKRRICKTRECGLFCSVPMHFILLPCVSYFAVATFYISTSKTSLFMSYYTLLPCIFQCLLDVFWTIPKVKSSQVQSYLNSYLQVSFQDLWISPAFYNIFTKAISSKDPFHWPCWPIEQYLGQKYIDK